MSSWKQEGYGIVSAEESDDEDYDIQHSKRYGLHKTSGLIWSMKDASFIVFTLCLLASIFCTAFWVFYPENSFLICGIIGLNTCIFGVIRFCMLFGDTRRTLERSKHLRRKLTIEKRHMTAQVQRTRKAMLVLQDTKHRIIDVNTRHKNNTETFNGLQQTMKQAALHPNICDTVSIVQKSLQQQQIQHEKAKLNRIYTAFMDHKAGNDRERLHREEFNAFMHQIPAIYRQILTNIHVFDHLDINQTGFIEPHMLSQYLDQVAEMEFESVDTLQTTNTAQNPEENEVQKVRLRRDIMDQKDVSLNEEESPPEMPGGEPVFKPKESLFSADYGIGSTPSEDEYEDEYNDRYNEDDDAHDEDGGGAPTLEPQRKSRRSGRKVISDDESWIQHQQKKGHMAHDSVIQLRSNKLVSGSRKAEESEEQTQFIGPTSKELQADNSWVKHQKKTIHPVHESVDALVINKLVSNAEIIKSLTPVAEDANDM